MKIIGGSFGLSGDAYIDESNMISIESTYDSTYTSEQIKSVSACVEKKFSALTFIIGAIILSMIFVFFLGLLGD